MQLVRPIRIGQYALRGDQCEIIRRIICQSCEQRLKIQQRLVNYCCSVRQIVPAKVE